MLSVLKSWSRRILDNFPSWLDGFGSFPIRHYRSGFGLGTGMETLEQRVLLAADLPTSTDDPHPLYHQQVSTSEPQKAHALHPPLTPEQEQLIAKIGRESNNWQTLTEEQLQQLREAGLVVAEQNNWIAESHYVIRIGDRLLHYVEGWGEDPRLVDIQPATIDPNVLIQRENHHDTMAWYGWLEYLPGGEEPPPPSYWAGVLEVYKGYWDAVCGLYEAGEMIVTDPAGAAEGLCYAVLHPLETAEAIYADLEEKSGTLRGQGQIVGDILLGILTGSKAADTAMDAIKAAKKASKVASKLDDAADAAKTATKLDDAAKHAHKIHAETPDTQPALRQSQDLAGAGCFLPGTPVWIVEPQHLEAYAAEHALDLVLQPWLSGHHTPTAIAAALAPTAPTTTCPIEQVPLGSRVLEENPQAEDVLPTWPENLDEPWYHIHLLARHENGTLVQMELLRPASWLDQHRWQPGQYVQATLPETNLSVWAHILSVSPTAPPTPGPGCLVTGRFVTLQASHLVEVQLEDGSTICGTANHPVWSQTRHNWVALGELQPGELLQGFAGPVAAQGVRPLPGSGRVYNLEIHGQRVYRIGSPGVLVHNNCFDRGSIRGKRPSWFLKNIPEGWKKLPADRGHGWKLVDENGVERLRFMYPNKRGRFFHEKTGYFHRKDQFGNYLDIDGNVVPPDHPLFDQLTHIPSSHVH